MHKSELSFLPFLIIRIIRRIPVVMAFCVFLATGAIAQVDRAVLEGTITDPTGATISGTTVKVLEVDTAIGQEQGTNSSGYYRFPGLAVGRYTVTITGVDFKTKVIEDVILQVGQTRTLDTKLTVGAPTETVEVQHPQRLQTAVPQKRPQSSARIRSRIYPIMAATGRVLHCSRRLLKTMAAETSALFVLPGARATTTTFRLTALMPAAFRSRLRSRKPDCRSLKTQFRNIA